MKQKLNKGFLMIEACLCLVIIAFTLIINLSIINTNKTNTIYLKEKDVLITNLNMARQIAINSQCIVNLTFKNNKFTIDYLGYTKEYQFKSIVFYTFKELYFNKTGSLNQAYTLMFKHGYQYHKLIFYLGRGWFKLE